jgi:hypothetical protein
LPVWEVGVNLVNVFVLHGPRAEVDARLRQALFHVLEDDIAPSHLAQDFIVELGIPPRQRGNGQQKRRK